MSVRPSLSVLVICQILQILLSLPILFIFFMILSRSIDVNTTLRDNKFVDSHSLYRLYWYAQLFDSILVLMNMFMMI